MLVNHRGVVLDINPSQAKFMRCLISPRRKLVFGTQDTDTLENVVDLAAKGKLSITIGRKESLNNAIGLIRDLEAGQRCNGKAVIVLG
jgi:hypothetical protein